MAEVACREVFGTDCAYITESEDVDEIVTALTVHADRRHRDVVANVPPEDMPQHMDAVRAKIEAIQRL